MLTLALFLLQAEPLAEARRLVEKGDLVSAIELLENARASSPSAPLLALLAQLQTENDEIPQAADTLAAALALAPEQHRLRITLGALYIRLRRYESARDQLERALERDPRNAIAQYYLAVVHKNEGNLEKALRHAENAARWMPRETPRLDGVDPSPLANSLYLLAQVRASLGDVDAAEPVLRRVMEMDPSYPGPHYLLGRLLLQKGRDEEGRQELEHFHRAKKAAEHVEMAENASRHAGKPDLALLELQRALEVYPDHPRGLYLLALELARRGERDQAMVCLRRVLELRPETEEVVRRLLSKLGR
jgi:tetratricopeptide (TPR) repeat protein